MIASHLSPAAPSGRAPMGKVVQCRHPPLDELLHVLLAKILDDRVVEAHFPHRFHAEGAACHHHRDFLPVPAGVAENGEDTIPQTVVRHLVQTVQQQHGLPALEQPFPIPAPVIAASGAGGAGQEIEKPAVIVGYLLASGFGQQGGHCREPQEHRRGRLGAAVHPQIPLPPRRPVGTGCPGAGPAPAWSRQGAKRSSCPRPAGLR